MLRKRTTSKLRKPFRCPRAAGIVAFPPDCHVPAHFDEGERRDFLRIVSELVKRGRRVRPLEFVESGILAVALGIAEETRGRIKSGIDVALNLVVLREMLAECRRSARVELKLSDESIAKLF